MTLDEEHIKLINDIHAMVREQRVELTFIREQTTKTNGKVIANTDRLNKLEKFQAIVLAFWGMAVSVVTLAINKFL